MADQEQYYSDPMFFDKNKYRPEVRLDEDGFYRWSCTLDNYHDRKMYRFLIRFWAVFALCGSVMGFLYASVPAEIVRKDPSRYMHELTIRRILYAIAGYALFFAGGLVITGLVRLIEGGPSNYWYRMNDKFIQIRPSGKGSGLNSFSEVKRVELYHSVNEIRLISRWGKCPVLVREKDFELVKKHILAHLPETAEITEKEVHS